jgi:hypothetical protein
MLLVTKATAKLILCPYTYISADFNHPLSQVVLTSPHS